MLFSVDMAAGRTCYSRAMYGHIHMMRTKPDPQLNMKEELYTDILRESVIYWFSAGTPPLGGHCFARHKRGRKVAALEILIKVCAAQSNLCGRVSRCSTDGYANPDMRGIVLSCISCGRA